MILPSNYVNIVLDRVNIVDVIGHDLNLTKKSGSNYLALCPFHSDSNPSLTVSEEKQIFKCFACGKGGDAVSFVMEHHRLGFKEAVLDLARRYSIPLPSTGEQVEFEKSLKEDIYKVNAIGMEWFVQQFKNADHAKKYMSDRGFNEKTLKSYSIGYAPASTNDLYQELSKKNIENNVLLKSGLFKDRHGVHDSDKLYSPFFDRLIFPIEDDRGRVLGFGGRMMKNQDGPKYLNTPETEVFHKRKILFGIKQAFEAIKKKKVVLIAEGYTDVMMMHQYEYTNTVAVMGTALTTDHVKKIKRFANEAVMVLDGDAAGQNAMMRSLDAFIAEEFPVYFAMLPEGKDPCDMLTSNDHNSFQKCIDARISLVDFVCKHLGSQIDLQTVDGKVKAGNAVIEILKSAHNPIQLSALITELSQKLQLDERGLREHFSHLQSRVASRQRFNTQEKAPTDDFKPESIGLNVERLLLSLAIKNESHYYDLISLEVQKFLIEPMIFEMFEKFTKAETWDKLNSYVFENATEKEKIFFNHLAYTPIELNGIDLEKEFNRLVFEHKKHRKNRLQTEIKIAESEKDTKRVNALWSEFANLK